MSKRTLAEKAVCRKSDQNANEAMARAVRLLVADIVKASRIA